MPVSLVLIPLIGFAAIAAACLLLRRIFVGQSLLPPSTSWRHLASDVVFACSAMVLAQGFYYWRTTGEFDVFAMDPITFYILPTLLLAALVCLFRWLFIGLLGEIPGEQVLLPPRYFVPDLRALAAFLAVIATTVMFRVWPTLDKKPSRELKAYFQSHHGQFDILAARVLDPANHSSVSSDLRSLGLCGEYSANAEIGEVIFYLRYEPRTPPALLSSPAAVFKAFVYERTAPSPIVADVDDASGPGYEGYQPLADRWYLFMEEG
jgi:hypothetical protein